MRPSCPSSQVTVNGRPLTVRLTCPKSSPFPQDATDPSESLIDARRDFPELCAIELAIKPADSLGGLYPSHGPFQPFHCRFELAHRATVRRCRGGALSALSRTSAMCVSAPDGARSGRDLATMSSRLPRHRHRRASRPPCRVGRETVSAPAPGADRRSAPEACPRDRQC